MEKLTHFSPASTGFHEHRLLRMAEAAPDPYAAANAALQQAEETYKKMAPALPDNRQEAAVFLDQKSENLSNFAMKKGEYARLITQRMEILQRLSSMKSDKLKEGFEEADAEIQKINVYIEKLEGQMQEATNQLNALVQNAEQQMNKDVETTQKILTEKADNIKNLWTNFLGQYTAENDGNRSLSVTTLEALKDAERDAIAYVQEVDSAQSTLTDFRLLERSKQRQSLFESQGEAWVVNQAQMLAMLSDIYEKKAEILSSQRGSRDGDAAYGEAKEQSEEFAKRAHDTAKAEKEHVKDKGHQQSLENIADAIAEKMRKQYKRTADLAAKNDVDDASFNKAIHTERNFLRTNYPEDDRMMAINGMINDRMNGKMKRIEDYEVTSKSEEKNAQEKKGMIEAAQAFLREHRDSIVDADQKDAELSDTQKELEAAVQYKQYATLVGAIDAIPVDNVTLENIVTIADLMSDAKLGVYVRHPDSVNVHTKLRPYVEAANRVVFEELASKMTTLTEALKTSKALQGMVSDGNNIQLERFTSSQGAVKEAFAHAKDLLPLVNAYGRIIEQSTEVKPKLEKVIPNNVAERITQSLTTIVTNHQSGVLKGLEYCRKNAKLKEAADIIRAEQTFVDTLRGMNISGVDDSSKEYATALQKEWQKVLELIEYESNNSQNSPSKKSEYAALLLSLRQGDHVLDPLAAAEEQVKAGEKKREATRYENSADDRDATGMLRNVRHTVSVAETIDRFNALAGKYNTQPQESADTPLEPPKYETKQEIFVQNGRRYQRSVNILVSSTETQRDKVQHELRNAIAAAEKQSDALVSTNQNLSQQMRTAANSLRETLILWQTPEQRLEDAKAQWGVEKAGIEDAIDAMTKAEKPGDLEQAIVAAQNKQAQYGAGTAFSTLSRLSNIDVNTKDRSTFETEVQKGHNALKEEIEKQTKILEMAKDLVNASSPR